MSEQKKIFLKIFKKVDKKYGSSTYRLAGEGWDMDWKLLVATIMSAQSRDETTIPIAEKLFKKYPSLKKLAAAKQSSIEKEIRSMNYYKTKSKHISLTAKMLIKDFKGKVPDTIEDLVKLPGVGRKTANLIITELHDMDGICVDTHVHRISNVFGIVKTKTPHQTELELMKVAPKKYWPRINRLFVLWGKNAPGRNPDKLLAALEAEDKLR